MLVGLLCLRGQIRWTMACSGCERLSTKGCSRCTLRKTDAKGDYGLSKDDKNDNEEFPEFFGGVAKFYDFRTGLVKFFR